MGSFIKFVHLLIPHKMSLLAKPLDNFDFFYVCVCVGGGGGVQTLTDFAEIWHMSFFWHAS